MNYIYTGIFFTGLFNNPNINGKEMGTLERQIEHPHVTFKYKPDFVDESLFSEEVTVTVTGYGNDGNNEGLLVEIHSDNQKIMKLAKEIAVPHITLSVSAQGKPVDTRYLEFEPIEHFELVGTFGGFINGKPHF